MAFYGIGMAFEAVVALTLTCTHFSLLEWQSHTDTEQKQNNNNDKNDSVHTNTDTQPYTYTAHCKWHNGKKRRYECSGIIEMARNDLVENKLIKLVQNRQCQRVQLDRPSVCPSVRSLAHKNCIFMFGAHVHFYLCHVFNDICFIRFIRW